MTALRLSPGLPPMNRIFTAWQSFDGTPITLLAGEGPPTVANGELQPDCDVMLWRVEAGTWEEARAIQSLRPGWQPYAPVGEASPCQNCGALLYREGRGQCWNCDREG